MTPAQEIRRAAETLRQRAQAATPGPWVPSKAYRLNVVAPDKIVGRGSHPGTVTDAPGESFNSANAAYIATLDPGVGEALADLLDNEASVIDGAEQYPDLHMPLNGARCDLLLAVARAINGGEA